MHVTENHKCAQSVLQGRMAENVENLDCISVKILVGMGIFGFVNGDTVVCCYILCVFPETYDEFSTRFRYLH